MQDNVIRESNYRWSAAAAGFALLLTLSAASAQISKPGRVFPDAPPDPRACPTVPVDVASILAATPLPVASSADATESMRLATDLARRFGNQRVEGKGGILDAPGSGGPLGDQPAGDPPSLGPFALLPVASAKDRAEIESLERIVIACRETGDPRRWFGLYTAGWQRATLASMGEAATDFFVSEAVPPLNRGELWLPSAVGPVVDVGNGRLAALVDFCRDRWVHVYEREGGEWRIAGEAEAPMRENEPTMCVLLKPATPTP
jgi:hypothetical protein